MLAASRTSPRGAWLLTKSPEFLKSRIPTLIAVVNIVTFLRLWFRTRLRFEMVAAPVEFQRSQSKQIRKSSSIEQSLSLTHSAAGQVELARTDKKEERRTTRQTLDQRAKRGGTI
jgi:hypothetical protein